MTVSPDFWERARRRCTYCRREISASDAIAVSYGDPRIAHPSCHRKAIAYLRGTART